VHDVDGQILDETFMVFRDDVRGDSDFGGFSLRKSLGEIVMRLIKVGLFGVDQVRRFLLDGLYVVDYNAFSGVLELVLLVVILPFVLFLEVWEGRSGTSFFPQFRLLYNIFQLHILIRVDVVILGQLAKT
jgi:hypothetical protein